jgi:hypothetical protein
MRLPRMAPDGFVSRRSAPRKSARLRLVREQICGSEIGAAKVGAGEIGGTELRPAQVAAAEIGASGARSPKEGPLEARPYKLGLLQACIREIDPVKRPTGEV